MNHYIELTLIKNSEISPNFIWSKLYTQLHLAFVEQKDENEQIPYGVSFPEYKMGETKGKSITFLGTKLRIFAENAQMLEKLNLHKWLERLTDYVHIKSISPIKDVKQYLNVSRYRPTPNIELLGRRIAKKRQISLEDAIEYRMAKGYTKKWEPYPYIKIKSLSGNSEFSLCINQKVAENPMEGKFSTYGLSSKTTVPHW